MKFAVCCLAIVSTFHVLVSGSAAKAQEPGGGDPTVVGQLEHEGFALVGSRGRFYLFGGLAVADYRDSAGTRRIVTLQREDQIQDATHIHYRELRERHRWAFSRAAGSDGQHGVWVQLAPTDPAATPKWQPFQRAQKEGPREATGGASLPVPVSAEYGECCGLGKQIP
jgi:hypothetical protein